MARKDPQHSGTTNEYSELPRAVNAPIDPVSADAGPPWDEQTTRPAPTSGSGATVLRRDQTPQQVEQAKLWTAIRQHTEQIGFTHFDRFVQRALCCPDKNAGSAELTRAQELAGDGFNLDPFKRARPCRDAGQFGFIPGADLYRLLRLASEIFLLLRCGVCRVAPGAECQEPIRRAGEELSDREPFDLPNPFGVADGQLKGEDLERLNDVLTGFIGHDSASYIRAITDNVFRGGDLTVSPFCPTSIGPGPCLMELIWSYWLEEGMLVQTTNAVAVRFQNIARPGRDPLAEFELDPLRPLGGFFWGYIQDAHTRLSVARRAYEYHHEYGLALASRAQRLRPADSRSKFLQAFHDLLRLSDQFYREAADRQVIPDPFPILIALRDLHMILAEGAHNQFRDLPWTARSEMLVQQWLLARPETREFLRGRLMTPYPEAWMGAVDAMKRLQGWSDTNLIHFSDLARFGERLLLSVRHVRWDAIDQPDAALEWALSWRGEIQGYVHAYRMVTGVTLSDDVVEVNSPDSPRYLQPSALLRARLAQQRRQRGLPAAPSRPVPQPRRVRALPQ